MKRKILIVTAIFTLFGFYNLKAQITGSGTTNYIPVFTNTTVIGNSALYQSGSNIGIGTTSPANLLDVQQSSTTEASVLKIGNSNGAGANQTSVSLGFYHFNSTYPSAKIVEQEEDNADYRGSLQFYTRGTDSDVSPTERMRILSGGNIGIGTTSPTSLFSVGSSSQFQVNSSGNIVKVNNITTSFPSSQGAASTVLKNDGSGNLSWVTLTSLSGITGSCSSGANYLPKMSSTSAITCSQIYDNGTSIGIGTTSPTDKLHVYGAFGIHMATDKNLHINGWDINSNGAMCIMAVNDANDASIPLNISASSVYFHSIVGIGTVNFNKNGTPYYKLAVCGPIKATEVVVETGWCDFVFDKDYKLKSLTEVEKYISENKHLPDVPSAADVAKNGVSLGQSDSVLLQKVEELTLYIIALNKRIETLEANQKN